MLLIQSCSQAKQQVLLCTDGNGCQLTSVNLSDREIEIALNKPGLLTATPQKGVLILDRCEAVLDKDRSAEEIHLAYGGTGPLKEAAPIDIKEYLAKNGCAGCPNPVKKVSFQITSPELHNSSYFFVNVNQDEAYMPNEAFQKLYAGQEGYTGITVDAFYRNAQQLQYIVSPDGQRYVIDMPIGTGLEIAGKQSESELFKKQFKATGRKRNYMQTSDEEIEYQGMAEGKPVTIWLGPAYDVCIPRGRSACWSFFSLGYLSVDDKTWLVTEIVTDVHRARVTGVSNDSYQFNAEGYKRMDQLIPGLPK